MTPHPTFKPPAPLPSPSMMVWYSFLFVAIQTILLTMKYSREKLIGDTTQDWLGEIGSVLVQKRVELGAEIDVGKDSKEIKQGQNQSSLL